MIIIIFNIFTFQFEDMLQVPIAAVSFWINLYTLWNVLKVKELRSLEYFLVALQSLVDLTFCGLFAIAHLLMHLVHSYVKFCHFANGAGWQYAYYRGRYPPKAIFQLMNWA